MIKKLYKKIIKKFIDSVFKPRISIGLLPDEHEQTEPFNSVIMMLSSYLSGSSFNVSEVNDMNNLVCVSTRNDYRVFNDSDRADLNRFIYESCVVHDINVKLCLPIFSHDILISKSSGANALEFNFFLENNRVNTRLFSIDDIDSSGRNLVGLIEGMNGSITYTNESVFRSEQFNDWFAQNSDWLAQGLHVGACVSPAPVDSTARGSVGPGFNAQMYECDFQVDSGINTLTGFSGNERAEIARKSVITEVIMETIGLSERQSREFLNKNSVVLNSKNTMESLKRTILKISKVNKINHNDNIYV